MKFTGSGTESTLLAIRVARSFTAGSTVLKLEGHFHGWHDYLLKGEKPPFEASSSPRHPAGSDGHRRGACRPTTSECSRSV